MRPGETDIKKRTIYFPIYDVNGFPASGEAGEGAVATFSTPSWLQVNRDAAGYVNATGTPTHIGDGFYSYVYATAEVAGLTEGTTLLRYKNTGFRTQVIPTDLRLSTDVADIFAFNVEGAKSFLQMIRIWNSIIRGRATLTPTGEVFYAEDDTTPRWQGTVISNIRSISSENGD